MDHKCRNLRTVFRGIEYDFPFDAAHIDRQFTLIVESPFEVGGWSHEGLRSRCKRIQADVKRIFFPVITHPADVSHFGEFDLAQPFSVEIVECKAAHNVFFILYDEMVFRDGIALHYRFRFGNQHFPIFIFGTWNIGRHQAEIRRFVVRQDIELIANCFGICVELFAFVDQLSGLVRPRLAHIHFVGVEIAFAEECYIAVTVVVDKIIVLCIGGGADELRLCYRIACFPSVRFKRTLRIDIFFRTKSEISMLLIFCPLKSEDVFDRFVQYLTRSRINNVSRRNLCAALLYTDGRTVAVIRVTRTRGRGLSRRV